MASVASYVTRGLRAHRYSRLLLDVLQAEPSGPLDAVLVEWRELCVVEANRIDQL